MILVAMLGIVAANVIMACLYKQAFYSKIYFLMMFAFSLFILLTASSLLYDDSVSGSINQTGNITTQCYMYVGTYPSPTPLSCGDLFVSERILIGGATTTFLLQKDLMNLSPVETAPLTCEAATLGAIYYDISEDNMCVCKSTGWKVIQDGSECT